MRDERGDSNAGAFEREARGHLLRAIAGAIAPIFILNGMSSSRSSRTRASAAGGVVRPAPSTMDCAALRDELQAAGLDYRGRKASLVDRYAS